MCYAEKYAHVLKFSSKDESLLLSDLLQLPPQTRLNAMKSITALSKYLGCYEQWQQMRKQHALKWTTGGEAIQAMERFFDPGSSLEAMLSKIKKMIAVLPEPMGLVVKHALCTGLRPSEAIESAKLIQNSETFPQYYDQKSMILGHYKWPNQFIKSTKKAYISFVTREQLSGITVLGCRIPTYSAIRQASRHRGLNMDMHLTRKIHGSWLLKRGGLAAEEIDFLHGRSNPSVFSRHYLSADNSLCSRVLAATKNLMSEITV